MQCDNMLCDMVNVNQVVTDSMVVDDALVSIWT